MTVSNFTILCIVAAATPLLAQTSPAPVAARHVETSLYAGATGNFAADRVIDTGAVLQTQRMDPRANAHRRGPGLSVAKELRHTG